MDFTDLKDWVSLTKDAMELMTAGYRALPKGTERDSAELVVKAAADALARGDAKLAKDLGFPVCQCTFPGEPMLWKKDIRKNVCGKCGDVYPRDHPILDAPHGSLARARRGYG